MLHLAGLSRPMNVHEKNISKSINLNIIGTCNIVNQASKEKLKLSIFQQAMCIQEKVDILKMIP